MASEGHYELSRLNIWLEVKKRLEWPFWDVQGYVEPSCQDVIILLAKKKELILDFCMEIGIKMKRENLYL